MTTVNFEKNEMMGEIENALKDTLKAEKLRQIGEEQGFACLRDYKPETLLAAQSEMVDFLNEKGWEVGINDTVCASMLAQSISNPQLASEFARENWDNFKDYIEVQMARVGYMVRQQVWGMLTDDPLAPEEFKRQILENGEMHRAPIVPKTKDEPSESAA